MNEQTAIVSPSAPTTHDSGFGLTGGDDDDDVIDQLLVVTDNELEFEPHTPPSDDGITVGVHVQIPDTHTGDETVIVSTDLDNGKY